MTPMDASGLSRPVLGLLGWPLPPMGLVSPRSCPADLRALLESVQLDEWFPGAPHPRAALTGLWLHGGGWEEAHTLAQGLSSAEGNYWHALVHRQEPDAGNAAYWLRRVGRHPVYERLAQGARALLESHPGTGFPVGETWDPFALVDLCEEARRSPGSAVESLALALQQKEWQLLFAWCAVRR
jgi:hypothetical protein